MPLAAEDLEQIKEYIKEEIPKILKEKGLLGQMGEWELRERIIRVEEELKAQRELMKQGFELMEKRFEQIDKRFEQIESRLEDLSRRMFHFMIWSFGFTATVAAIVIAVLK